MNLKFWKPKPAPLRVNVISREASKLRLQEWRQDAKLCGTAEAVFQNPNVRLMLDVLNNESPVNYVGGTPTPDEKILRLGVIQGYHLAINTLEAMAQFKQPDEQLTPTFEPEDKE